MNNILQIEKLKVEFNTNDGKLIAINNFTLSVKEHEFISIIGLSGCGKTTLLNILGGFLFPTSGVVLFEEKVIQKPSVDRVLVFQEESVFPWYTVEENIAYSLKIKMLNEAESSKIINKYLEAVGLISFRNFYPKDLSGGMKKRVDLARAYAANPKILLMDEPFGSLDTYTRQQMQLQLLNLNESEKKTIIFVTHDISEAIFLSDRVVLMTSSPGSIDKVFDVPFIRPRKAEIKKTQDFMKLLTEIDDLIHIQEKSHEERIK